jgi:hypothetical protein
MVNYSRNISFARRSFLFRFYNKENKKTFLEQTQTMKKILFLAGAVTFATGSFAQNGFYLSPSIGAGISNTKQDFFSLDPNGSKIKRSNILSYNGSLNVGYKLNHWRFEAGIQYSISGYKMDDLVFGNNFPDTTPQGSSEVQYQHLSIPLKVGYEIRLGNKFNLIPLAGIVTSYNLGATSINNLFGEGKKTYPWTKERFDYDNHRISIWGTAALRAEYKLSNRISIFAGPSVQYMISNLLKSPYSNPVYNASQRNYTVNFDLGVNIKL